MEVTTTTGRLIWTLAINAAAMAIHIALLLQTVKASSLAALIFILIVAAPPLLISVSAVFLGRTDAPRRYIESLSAIYLVLGAWTYYDAIYVHPDPQNGIIFIFVPILGFVITSIVVAIMFAVFGSTEAPSTAKRGV